MAGIVSTDCVCRQCQITRLAAKYFQERRIQGLHDYTIRVFWRYYDGDNLMSNIGSARSAGSLGWPQHPVDGGAPVVTDAMAWAALDVMHPTWRNYLRPSRDAYVRDIKRGIEAALKVRA
jgi:hypothetical protein